MADTNGRNRWIMWLVGLLSTVIIIIALPTMAKAIWDNDRTNNVQHTIIMETMIERDEILNEKISAFSIEQMRQGTILSRIDQKL